MSILDQVIEKRELAKEKLASGEMLSEEDESDYTSLLRIKKQRPMKANIFESQTLQEQLAGFDPETATKKQIRALRKALSALSNEKYPKKKK